VNINSEVGMGKFYFIAVLYTHSELAATAGKLLLLVRVTPTSVIAFSINS
jgi:hypothetical protein